MSIELFRDDDQGYAAWLAANGQGYVLNIQRTLNPSDARMHWAGCRDDHGNAAARHDVDRAVRQGMLRVTAGPGRLGARPHREGYHQVRHMPAAGRLT